MACSPELLKIEKTLQQNRPLAKLPILVCAAMLEVALEIKQAPITGQALMEDYQDKLAQLKWGESK